MRKVFPLTVLILLVLFGKLDAQDQKKVTDFRDIKWGVHKDSVFRDGAKVNFTKVEDGVDPNSYTIPNDKMTIGAVELEKVQYIFNEDNRFKKVFLQADRNFHSDMKFILNYKFGKSDRDKQTGYVEVKSWQLDGVIFTLSKFINRDIFTLTIESNWEKSAEIQKNKRVDDF